MNTAEIVTDHPGKIAIEALPEMSAEVVKNRSKLGIFTVLSALFSVLFIAALNSTTVATSIPTICAHFHSASGYAWIGGAYSLANAAAAPIWVKLSDIWGRKVILLTAVASYFASSVICATSMSMRVLILGRALQGIAGGGLFQPVIVTISDMFSMRTRTLYLGLLQVIWALASGIGPVIGGALAEHASWRWVFWVNLPTSGTAFVLLLIYLDVHNPRTKFVDGIKAVDWFGSLFMVAFLVMLLLGLSYGGEVSTWSSATVICLLIFGALMSVLFILSEKRLTRYPLMPFDLFSHKSNMACLVVRFAQDFALCAAEYYLPLYFQSVKEATPTHSGLLVLPITLTQSLVGVVTGVSIHRTGRYLELIWAGVILSTIGTGLYIHLNATSSIKEIISFEILAAIGSGMLFDPPLIALQTLVSQKNIATATSTLGFSGDIGLSLAAVLGGVVFQNEIQSQAKRLSQAGLSDSVVQILSGDAAAANLAIIGTIADPDQKYAVKRAYAGSLSHIWIMCTCVSACGILASTFIIKRVLSTEHKETVTGIKDGRELA